MKCLLCRAELHPGGSENSPRVIIGAGVYGACPEHFPSKRQAPLAYEAAFRGFTKIAQAVAERCPSSAVHIAAVEGLLARYCTPLEPAELEPAELEPAERETT